MHKTPASRRRAKVAQALAQRLSEPSTMAGIAALAVLFGAPPGIPEAAVQGVAAVAGIAAVLMPEGRR